MNEQQTQAASSPAEVVDVFNGERVSMSEYSQYRSDGTLPERFKPAEPAESAPADPPEETVVEPESADESETPEETQEQPPKATPAEKRIKQLLAEKKELQRKLEQAAKSDVKPDSSPAQAQQPQTYQEWRKDFKPSQWTADYGAKNPEATYEEINAAMADYLGDARDHFRGIEQARQAQAQSIKAKVEEASAKYENFDEVSQPFVKALVEDAGIPMAVKVMVSESEIWPDLVFTLAGDEKFLEMAKTSPGKALRYIAKVENLIQDELSKPSEAAPRDENGKFTKAETPAPPTTKAPKPPSPVSGGSSRAFDVSDESLSTSEWMRKRNADLARKG